MSRLWVTWTPWTSVICFQSTVGVGGGHGAGRGSGRFCLYLERVCASGGRPYVQPHLSSQEGKGQPPLLTWESETPKTKAACLCLQNQARTQTAGPLIQ